MRKPKAEPKSLWRFWEFLAVIVGILATLELTSLLPILYWPGVILVYIGFGGVVIEGMRGRWHEHALLRIAISVIGLVGFAWWTCGVVFADVPLTIAFQRSMGEYADGTPVGDIKWDSNWSDLRVYLTSPQGHDLQDIDLQISIKGEMIPKVSQLESVCEGFHGFSVSAPTALETSTGPIIPTGTPMANNFRIVCDKLPRNSTGTIIIPILSTNDWTDPAHPPKFLTPPKRLVQGCRIFGEYRGLGKTRAVDMKCEFPN
jgi:hypothetical protein